MGETRQTGRNGRTGDAAWAPPGVNLTDEQKRQTVSFIEAGGARSQFTNAFAGRRKPTITVRH